MELFHKVSQFPFMQTRRVWYGVSAAAIVGSFLLLIFRGLNMGLDFTGGAVVELAFQEPVNVEQVRTALDAANLPGATVQTIGSSREISVRVQPESGNDEHVVQRMRDRVLTALQTIDPKVEVRNYAALSAQVGEELFNQGGLAILFTFIFILIYVAFRFEKKMGAGAIIAAMHDPIVILGAFSLTQITFDLSAVAAMLAVIGYSLNDTVVVFDRVRDNFLSMRKSTPTQVLDASVNQTLSRTVITSGATFMVVVVLLLLGGESLKPFSSALTVGILVGTYSSIYVAAAIALDLGLTATDLMPVQKDKEVDELP